MVTWTGFFLINRKIQLIIDKHNNKNKELETGICSRSPISLNLFLIYISGILNKIFKTSLLITSLLFIDNLGFITSGNLVKKFVKIFENIAKVILKWGNLNAITYNISKSEADFFLKLYLQRLNKQLSETKIKVGAKKISFNQKTIHWLQK